ncbi:GNAT family N-acetyltransferase [Paenibacillus sp. RC67]|uniref:GNAT family N-acetyltransferase n=1 Tax=Paenibacillus sp. RC67 TaxID=3039392 RepID=UPI0024ADAEC8|nr:GNAT family N-acetyltransferase [Paenibacillus sp. RC67]
MTQSLEIRNATTEEAQYIRNKLIEYNAEHIPVELQFRYEPIHLTIKDEVGNIAAGLLAVMKWNWIEVDILWVDKGFRQMGYGTELLSKVESIAR